MDSSFEDEQRKQSSNGSCVSDSESVTSGTVSGISGSCENGLIKLREEDEEHVLLKHKLYSSLKSAAKHCKIVSVHRISHSSDSAKARFEAFQIYAELMLEKRGGDPNIKQAWYGTSRDGFDQIIRHGFDLGGASEETGLYGLGVYLYPETSAIDSLVSAAADEDGLRHLLFCKVLLGNTEEVFPVSKQCHSSTEEFDSGVDNHKFPKKYIVWPAQMKTHILPLYVLSIRLDFQTKVLRKEPVKKPSSPWIPFSALIPMLSRRLPPPTMSLIKRYHNAYTEKKITRQQLIFLVRKLSGDKLLLVAVKSFQSKIISASIISALKKEKGL